MKIPKDLLFGASPLCCNYITSTPLNVIQIAAVGNWHDFNDMSQAQKDSLKNIIIDCLWSFTGISRTK